MRTKSIFLLVVFLVLGLMVGTVTAVSLIDDGAVGSFKINENGQTYGYFVPANNPDEQKMPQLIAAIGSDGTVGYVNIDDLNKNLPANPEEAVEYMIKLEENSRRESSMQELSDDVVPLYDKDGVTIIGQFEIGVCSVDLCLDQAEME